ncbi:MULTISPECIES: hypothetical protein [Sphingobacterium]|uniref:hypothetical protein n=1 Tax=Sphingobacterium TaxID=28453 RepID=UPI002580E60D|nr:MULTISPECIES: hypothetical protein [Sphingobacterium]
MKLAEIIEALKTGFINNLLDQTSGLMGHNLIFIYAELSVNVDAEYHLIIDETVSGKDYRENNTYYEVLCQLSVLDELVREYSKIYPRKTSDILAIDIVDHIENNF